MKALIDAQVSAFALNGTLTTAFPGGIWLEQADEGTAMPYLVMNVISSPTTSRYGAAAYSEPQIQYTAFAAGAATATAAAETFVTVWDETNFTLASGKNLFNRRVHEPIPLPGFPQLDEQAKNAFAVAVTYAYATT